MQCLQAFDTQTYQGKSFLSIPKAVKTCRLDLKMGRLFENLRLGQGGNRSEVKFVATASGILKFQRIA